MPEVSVCVCNGGLNLFLGGYRRNEKGPSIGPVSLLQKIALGVM